MENNENTSASPAEEVNKGVKATAYTRPDGVKFYYSRCTGCGDVRRIHEGSLITGLACGCGEGHYDRAMTRKEYEDAIVNEIVADTVARNDVDIIIEKTATELAEKRAAEAARKLSPAGLLVGQSNIRHRPVCAHCGKTMTSARNEGGELYDECIDCGYDYS